MSENRRELSLYIHIPFCKAKCIYCDFLSFGECSYPVQKRYMDALINEICAYEDIKNSYIVKTIYIGGGTPSFVDSSLIVLLMEKIKTVFLIDKNAEITIEGNPDSLSREHLEAYRKAGINRLSIGLQSANAKSLKRLSRVHNYDQFVAAYNSARQVGFCNINVDIMSGLMGETLLDYIHTLAKVVEMEPEHISAYSLIVEDGTVLSEEEELLKLLPSEEVERQMYARTKTLLKNSGYERYEISNYAKTGFECRHNMVYWTGGEYLGLGLCASSYMKVYLAPDYVKTVRFHGTEDLNEYLERFDRGISMREDEYTNLYYEMNDKDADYSVYEDNAMLCFWRDYYKEMYFSKRNDEMEEMMFLGLRMMRGVSKQEFQKRFGVNMESIYGKVINKYCDMGLLLERDGQIALSDAGIDVSNVVMAEFML